jgi:DNA-binding transcriptional LysR family regulator
MSHDHILKGIDNLEVDCGLTYLDHAVLGRLASVPLYAERYALLVAPGGPLADRREIAWSQAGALPLCLLTPDMQHRRIVERHLNDAGVAAAPRIESNSLVILMAHVRTGRFASIMPSRFVRSMDPAGTLRAIPIVEPPVNHLIGLAARRREPQAPLVAALFAEARHFAGEEAED